MPVFGRATAQEFRFLIQYFLHESVVIVENPPQLAQFGTVAHQLGHDAVGGSAKQAVLQLSQVFLEFQDLVQVAI